MNNYYVYFLIDPITGLPFYVGKGKGKRAEKHLHETIDNTENKKKWAYIQGLRNKGFEPKIHYVYKDLDEQIAYDSEEAAIAFFGRKGIDPNGILTNICPNNRPPKTIGRVKTPQEREAARQVGLRNKGIKRTEEFKNNLRKPRNPDLVKRSHEYQLKYKAKKVLCVETGQIFESLKAAAKHVNASNITTISNCAKGLHKIAYNYTWQFV